MFIKHFDMPGYQFGETNSKLDDFVLSWCIGPNWGTPLKILMKNWLKTRRPGIFKFEFQFRTLSVAPVLCNHPCFACARCCWVPWCLRGQATVASMLQEYMKIQGQSGKMTFATSEPIGSADDKVQIDMAKMEELAADGSVLGAGGNAKHSFNSFATQEFTFGTPEETTIRGVSNGTDTPKDFAITKVANRLQDWRVGTAVQVGKKGRNSQEQRNNLRFGWFWYEHHRYSKIFASKFVAPFKTSLDPLTEIFTYVDA